MLKLNQAPQTAAKSRLIAGLARNDTEVLEAQRLRHKTFTEDMGANFPDAPKGIDRDIYDKYCEHLLVRESDDNKVIGTYRILSPDQALNIGGYYSQTQFDLTRLLHLRGRMAEAGRACVHRDYRNATTLDELWGGIIQYMKQNRYEHLIGCVSISIADGGHIAASIYRKLYRIYSAPIEYRVFPRNPLNLETLNPYLDAAIPSLLKSYLRMGAYICGEPAWNPAFNTAELFMLLPMSRIPGSHNKSSRK